MAFKDDVARYALQKHVLKVLSDENKLLGADINDACRQLYEDVGTKQVTAEVDGAKVGTISITSTKQSDEIAVTDRAALYQWALDNGYTAVSVDMGRIKENFEQTGEVPDGCRVEHKKGGAFKGISCRFDKESKANIARIMGSGVLGEAVRGLIGQ